MDNWRGDRITERRKRSRPTKTQALRASEEASMTPIGRKSSRRRSRPGPSCDENDWLAARRPPMRGGAFAWVLGGSLLIGGVGHGTTGVARTTAFVCGTAGGGRWRGARCRGGCELGFAVAGTRQGTPRRGSLEIRHLFRLSAGGEHGLDSDDEDDEDDNDLDQENPLSSGSEGSNVDKRRLTVRLKSLLRPRSSLFSVGEGRKRGAARSRGAPGDIRGRGTGGGRSEVDAIVRQPPMENGWSGLDAPGGSQLEDGKVSSGTRQAVADVGEGGFKPLLSKDNAEQSTEDNQASVNTSISASSTSETNLDELEMITTGRRRCPPTNGRVSGFRDDYKANSTRGGENAGGIQAVEVLADARHPVLAVAIRILSEPSNSDGTLPAHVEAEARPSWARTGEAGNGGEGSEVAGCAKESKVSARSARTEQQAPLAEVRPPRRSFQLYFNHSAESPLSVITLGTHLFGDMLSLAHAPFVSRGEQAAYLEEWVTAAHAHGVVPEELMPLLPDNLRRISHGPNATVNGATDPVIDGASEIEEQASQREGRNDLPDVMTLSGRDASPDAWWRTYGWRPFGLVANGTLRASKEKGEDEQSTALGQNGEGQLGVGLDAMKAVKERQAGNLLEDEDSGATQSTANDLMRILNFVAKKNQSEAGNRGGELRTAKEIPDASGDMLASSSESYSLSSSHPSATPSNIDLARVMNEAELSNVWDEASKADALDLLRSLEDMDGAWMVDLLKTVDKLCSTPSSDEVAEGGDEVDHGQGGDAGEVGQVGWRVLEAVEHAYRSKARSPRVIVIGDVHGCLEELGRLVKEVDYWPGDLLLFLGDLVAKGPDSAGVVRMARDLGGVTVRGNHELEVIRWLHLEQSDDQDRRGDVRRTRHRQIASTLSPEDAGWLLASPWYIASADLDALFVHAGFVPGTRLSEQDPFMMISMRSITANGVVTSNHLPGEGWASHWDGSKTVFFGHDAVRGLQVLDRAIGLDTGCVYGGGLTAYVLPSNEMIRVDSNKYTSMKRSRRKRPFAEARLKLKPRGRRQKTDEDALDSDAQVEAKAGVVHAAALAAPSDDSLP